jgi:ArsR family transcriptional regulator
MDEYIKVFKALGDAIRLRILNVLLQDTCCVSEVVYALSIRQTRASHHLKILFDAGFLKTIRKGSCVYYYLPGDDLADPSKIGLSRIIAEISGKDPVFNKDLIRLRKIKYRTKNWLRSPANALKED